MKEINDTDKKTVKENEEESAMGLGIFMLATLLVVLCICIKCTAATPLLYC